MMRAIRRLVPAIVATLGCAVFVVGVESAQGDKQATAVGSAAKTLLFSSDGMRPDLMQRYAAQGAMPTYARLMRDGVIGENGMEQAFPPNTGVGWYTMATGTWPSEHGS